MTLADDAPERLAKNFLIARESDPADRTKMSLLQGMVHQTLLQYRDLLNLGPYSPEAVRDGAPESDFDRLMAWGASPARDDFEVRGLRRVAFREGRSRGYEFWVGPNVFLYSVGSASKADLDRENSFVTHVAKRIEELRPENVLVATFSRLIRANEFSGTLLSALKSADSTLYAGGEHKIQVSEFASEAMFSLFSLFSAQERSAIVTRLLHGKINKVRRGEWFLGNAAIPLGYRIGQHGRLEANPEMQPHVAKVIDMLGDPRMTPAHFVTNLADIGISPPSDHRGWRYMEGWDPGEVPYDDRVLRHSMARPPASHLSGEAVEVDDDEDLLGDDLVAPLRTRVGLPDPSAVMKRCYRYLDLWQYGKLVVRQKNALPGVRAYADLQVQGASRNSPGFVELVYDRGELSLPEGWAAEERIERARELKATRESNPLRGQSRFPFVGPMPQWNESYEPPESATPAGLGPAGMTSVEREYYVTSTSRTRSNHNPPTYDLQSRPATLMGEPWRSTRAENALEGRVAVHRLHRAIVGAAIEAFRDGVRLESVDSSAQRDLEAQWHAETQRLSRELDAALAEANRELEELSEARRASASPRELALRQRRVDDTGARIERLEHDLAQRPEAPPRRRVPLRFNIVAAELAQALTTLGTSDAPLEPEVVGALAGVLHEFRLRKVSALEFEFRFYLLLPTEDGAVRAGPIVGTCPVVGRILEPRVGRDRGADIARRLMVSDGTLDGVLRPVQTTGADDLVRAEAYLRDRGVPPASVRALLGAVPVETRRAIWHLLHPDEHGVADGSTDHRFMEMLRSVYLGEVSQRAGQGPIWFAGSLMQTEIVNYLSTREWVPRALYLDWLEDAGFSAAGYNRYVLKSASEEGSEHPYLAIARPLGGRGRPAPESVGLFDCPHCMEAFAMSVYVPVPEVRTGLLCRHCLRSRAADSPQYPASYLHVTRAEAERRLLAVHPDERLRVGIMSASVELRRRAQSWEQERGDGAARVAVTDALLERYLHQVAAGGVRDPGAIREWARATNAPDVGDRGRLRPEVVRQFGRDFLPVDLGPVRDWLAAQTRRLPPRGEARLAALDDYTNFVHDLHS